jgi:hypothetical protein
MIYPMWRLSEDTPDNLGLAFTDDGLLLGRTPLIERRGGRFVAREPSEIARLVKYSFPNGVAVDRLMPGLARVSAALNANDQALARIAAVHLQIPDLPSLTKRNAMIAEDALIKYARDGGVTAADWDPALHPRARTPPNPGWFAPVDGGPSSHADLRPRFAENVHPSHRTDATPTNGGPVKPSPGNPMDEPAIFADQFGAGQQASDNKFWSTTWPSIKSWLEQPVPQYDIESGKVVGQRPRWQAIAPYVGIPVATAAIFGLEAFAPAIAAWFGLGGSAPEIGTASEIAAPRFFGSFAVPEDIEFGTTRFGNYAHDAIEKLPRQRYPGANFVFRTRPGQTGVDVEVEQKWIDVVRFRFVEIKPMTASGRTRFNRQVLNWDLPEPVQPLTYDAAGNILWWFH